MKAMALGLIVLLALVFGPLILMFAWNLVVAELFGGPVIGFLHAVGIVILIGFVRGIFTVKGSKS